MNSRVSGAKCMSVLFEIEKQEFGNILLCWLLNISWQFLNEMSSELQ